MFYTFAGSKSAMAGMDSNRGIKELFKDGGSCRVVTNDQWLSGRTPFPADGGKYGDNYMGDYYIG